MPFNIPDKTKQYWRSLGLKPVDVAEIATLERHVGLKAPVSYVDFMKTYGGVEFDDEINSRFEYTYQEVDRSEVRSQSISFIKTPARTQRYYDGLQNDPKINLPPHLIPFGMDYGQGELLIEFGQPTERVFYWNYDAHNWESGETRIGFVANNLYDFINHLQPSEE